MPVVRYEYSKYRYTIITLHLVLSTFPESYIVPKVLSPRHLSCPTLSITKSECYFTQISCLSRITRCYERCVAPNYEFDRTTFPPFVPNAVLAIICIYRIFLSRKISCPERCITPHI